MGKKEKDTPGKDYTQFSLEFKEDWFPYNKAEEIHEQFKQKKDKEILRVADYYNMTVDQLIYNGVEQCHQSTQGNLKWWLQVNDEIVSNIIEVKFNNYAE